MTAFISIPKIQRRSFFMAKAKKLPSGSYRVLVYTGKDTTGKRLYESFTADSAKKAEYEALEFQLEKNRKSKPENMTIGETIDKYINSKNSLLSPNTIREYKRKRKMYYTKIETIKLEKISNDILQNQINNWAKQGLSPKTLSDINSLLVSSIEFSYPDFKIKVYLPEIYPKETKIPSDDEVVRIISASKGTVAEVPILLAAFMGMRKSEIEAITEKDVNLLDKTITINKSTAINSDNERVYKKPKTKDSVRTLLMPDIIFETLKLRVENGEPIISSTASSFYKSYKKALKKAETNDYRFHDLRHYYASSGLAMNIPYKYLAEFMGHSTDHMLKKVYGHKMDESTKKFADEMAKHYDDILKK